MSSTDCECLLDGMHRVLLFVRINIYETYSSDLIKTMDYYTQMLIKDEQPKVMDFKSDILSRIPESGKELEFLSSFNTQHQFSKFQLENVLKYLPFFSEILNLAQKELQLGNYEAAYQLVDAVHFFPQLLIEYKRWDKPNYWNTYITGIGYNWNEGFLQKWEHQFQTKSLIERLKSVFK